MASSDPPFDAADEPTTQPLRRQESAPTSDAGETPTAGADGAEAAEAHSRDEATADGHEPAVNEPGRVLRQNTNWFEPGFEAEDDPTSAVTQPAEAPPQEASEPAPQFAGEPELQIPFSVEPTESAPAEVPYAAASEPAPEGARLDEHPVEPAFELPVEPPHAQRVDPPLEPVEFVPPISAEPVEATVETPAEPAPMDTVAAEIAAALRAIKPTHAPTGSRPTVFDSARAYVAPAPIHAPAPAPAYAPAPYIPAPAQPERTRLRDLALRAGKVAVIGFCAWFCVVLALIALYRFVNPPFSSLMAAQWLGGREIRQDWVPLESISPALIHAVVVSEDGRFCEHWGIDFVEIAEALKRTPHGPARGASTITMQVAKNLFLWPAKSYVRKVIEVPLTYAIELFWPKRRILEVYLNIAEWGPGIFGAEAASQAHFNRPASRLSARQAAQLAVALPNPIVRDAGAPGPRTAHQASLIQRRTGREPEAIGCVLGGE